MNDDSQKVFLCFFSEKQDKYLGVGAPPPPPLSSFVSETSFTRLRGALRGYCTVYVDVYVTHLRL